jgi:hypothetical protein
MNTNLGIVWGADGIARVINRSPDYVRRTLAKMPDSPVHQTGRRYWAYPGELRSFFDHLAGKTHKNPQEPTFSQFNP